MEFRETEEQVACLNELGADYAQGFYYARPRPLDELEDEVRGRRQTA